MVNATIWSFDFVEDVAVHDEIHVALPNDLNQDFVMKVQEHIRMEQAGLMIDCSLEKKRTRSFIGKINSTYNHFFVVELEIDIQVQYDQ
jgi:uncharacterized protein Veg